jgi:hypothetical protein
MSGFCRVGLAAAIFVVLPAVASAGPASQPTAASTPAKPDTGKAGTKEAPTGATPAAKAAPAAKPAAKAMPLPKPAKVIPQPVKVTPPKKVAKKDDEPLWQGDQNQPDQER